MSQCVFECSVNEKCFHKFSWRRGSVVLAAWAFQSFQDARRATNLTFRVLNSVWLACVCNGYQSDRVSL